MQNMLAIKDNDVCYLLIESYGVIENLFDEPVAKNNYHIRVLNNDNGKIIIAAVGTVRGVQVLLEEKNIIKKNEFVDFCFMENVFKPRLFELLKHEYNGKIVNDKDEYDFPINIMVIANGEIFYLNYDGILEEGSFMANYNSSASINHMLYDSYEVHDERYLLELARIANMQVHKNANQIMTINDKTFKLSIHQKGGM